MQAQQPNTTYGYVTLKQLLAEVKMKCRVDHTTAEDIYIIPCILECAKEMMTVLDFQEKTATLPIANLTATLPQDFITFDRKDPIVFTTNGQVNTSQYYSNFYLTYTGGAFLTANPNPSQQLVWGLPTVQVQGGNLSFSSNITATECTISYMGCNIDEDGNQRIPQLNARPITEGASYLYKRNRGDSPSSWQDHKLLWVNGIGDRRGIANLPDSIMLERLKFMFNSM